MDERQQTVLIIDDVHEDRVMIRRYLTQGAPQTYRVIEAARGDVGLQLWREHQPDCILLDYQLPDIDGLTLLTTLEREAASPLPVVMVVGNSDTTVTVEALKRGAQDFLLKDRLTPAELRHTVANAIEKVALQRRIAAERAALRTSEERLRLAVEVGAIGIWDIDLRSGVRIWSDQGKAIYGLAAHEPMDYERQLTLIHPDDRALVHGLVTAFRDDGTLKHLNFEHRIVRPDGAIRWAAVRGEAIYDGAALPVRLIGTVIDITERKVAEADAHFLADMAERIRLADDADDLLLGVQQAIGEYLQINRCFFMEIDQDHDRSLIRRDYCRDMPTVAGEFRLSDYSPITRAELEAGRTLINCDSQTNPRTAAWYTATYEPAGERAYIGVPLLREGRWVATLSVTSKQVRQWQPREIALLETIAERTWLAVEKLRLDATMRFQAQVLAQVSDPVIAIDNAYRVTYWNQGAEQQYGITARDILGQPLTTSHQHRWLNAEDERASQDALAATGAWHGENIHRLSDGREIYVESSVSRLTDVRGVPTGLLAVIRDISARKRAAAASALLAEASSALAARDEAGMLEHVMDLIVPAFADWCMVHYVTDTGQIKLGASRCADPTKAALLHELHATYHSDPSWARNNVSQAIGTKQPILVADIPEDWPERIAAEPTHQRLLRALAPRSFLMVPLMARGRLLGLLTWATAESDRRYETADLDLAQELGRRAALALDNARLYVAERQARATAEAIQQRLAFLADISRMFAETLDYTVAIKRVVEFSVPRVADWCAVNLLDADGRAGLLAIAPADPSDEPALHILSERHALDHTALIGVPQVVRTGRPEFYPVVPAVAPAHTTRDEQHTQPPLPPLQSYLCVPIMVDGTLLAALTWATAQQGRRYTSEDLAFAEEVAHRIALAIDKALAYAAEQTARTAAERAIERIVRLQALTAACAEMLTPTQIGNVVVRHANATLGAMGGLLALVVDDGADLKIIHTDGYALEVVEGWRRFSLDAAVPLAAAVRDREMVLIESLDDYTRFPDLAHKKEIKKLRSLAAIPLIVDARIVGVLGLSFATFRTFSADDRALMRALAQQAAQAVKRAQLYDAERQARAMAEAAVQVRDQFLTMAAHELKNPLTSLLGNAQLLERRAIRDDTMGERDRRTVRTMVNQASRLNTMITTLLDISRMETGQLTLDRAELDLGALLRRLVEELRPTLSQHSLLYDIPDQPLTIDGDKLRLEQVFQNLLSNAVKYSPAGGTISVRVERQEQQVCVRVTDQGIGIPAEALPQLFQRFYRVAGDATQQISGLGIGLYVVRDMVMLHGGEVQVASVEGQGSTFSVCLPLLPHSQETPGTPVNDSAVGR
jgi:PAS domain S-box-containing protein